MSKQVAKKQSPPQNKSFNPETGKIEVTSTQMISSEFHGPIPSPQMLKQYDEVSPGLAEKIIATWQAEGQHRQQMEKQELKSFYIADYAGKFSATLFSLSALAAAAFALHLGYPTAACVLGGGTIASVVAAFLHYRSKSAR